MGITDMKAFEKMLKTFTKERTSILCIRHKHSLMACKNNWPWTTQLPCLAFIVFRSPSNPQQRFHDHRSHLCKHLVMAGDGVERKLLPLLVVELWGGHVRLAFHQILNTREKIWVLIPGNDVQAKNCENTECNCC